MGHNHANHAMSKEHTLHSHIVDERMKNFIIGTVDCISIDLLHKVFHHFLNWQNRFLRQRSNTCAVWQTYQWLRHHSPVQKSSHKASLPTTHMCWKCQQIWLCTQSLTWICFPHQWGCWYRRTTWLPICTSLRRMVRTGDVLAHASCPCSLDWASRARAHNRFPCSSPIYRVVQQSKPLPNDQKIVLKPVSEIRFIRQI